MRRIVFAPLIAALALTFAPVASASFIITPTFGSSITSNANAALIEGSINSAISTLEGLYTNNATLAVTFTYTAAAPGNLLETTQDYYDVSYSTYKGLLQADSTANPQNTVLATAIAHLSSGNDANGSEDLAVAGGLLAALGISTDPGNATININSNQVFAFSRPVPSNEFDLIGGLEHELDEVMGGGGAGSTLNSIAGSCVTAPTGFFCNKVGPTDLYRYSAAGTPSFTTSSSATPYLSVNGGVTSIVSLNQNSGGDFGDFAPPGTGPGQLIQNAFNSTGQDEAYTNASPEFLMEESIGWNPASTVSTVPEPGTWMLLATGLAVLGFTAYRRSKPA
jgi:hypothetical protein